MWIVRKLKMKKKSVVFLFKKNYTFTWNVWLRYGRSKLRTEDEKGVVILFKKNDRP